MRVAIIGVNGGITTDGPRLISALLKREGHSVKCVFLTQYAHYDYRDDEVESLNEILKDVDLTMMAIYSPYVNRAVQITNLIRKNYPGMKVIWGGPHCVAAPEVSLEHADGVCYAEGDTPSVDLVNKMEKGVDYLGTPNMGFKVGSNRIINKVGTPYPDLNNLPFLDYEMEDHFILNGKLSLLTKKLYREYCTPSPFGHPTFYMMTSRGCPFNCTFCNNNRYITMYGHNRMRFRSVDHFVGELEQIKEKYDFYERIAFLDDDFFLRPNDMLEEFALKYKKRVGLPFGVFVTANAYREKKLEIMMDSGLDLVHMGVQSGSQRTIDEVYDRNISVTKTNEVAHKLEPYGQTRNLKVLLDFIIDNPYENEDDIIETVKYLIDVIPLNMFINVYALTFYPGTALYKKAVDDGYVDPDNTTQFRRFSDLTIVYQKNYASFLLMLVYMIYRREWAKRTPWVLIHFMTRPTVRKIAKILPENVHNFFIKRVMKLIPEDSEWEKVKS